MTTTLSNSLLEEAKKTAEKMPGNIDFTQIPGQPFIVSKNLLADEPEKRIFLREIEVAGKEYYIYQLME